MRNKQKLISGVLSLALVGTVFASLAFAETTDTSTTTTSQTNTRKASVKSKLDAVQQKVKQAKTEALIKLEQSQTNRAQKELDRLSAILDRIVALRAKMSTTAAPSTTTTPSTTAVTPDFTAIDATIAKAKTQKADAQKAIDDLKAKAAALQAAIAKTAGDDTTTAITTPVQTVKDFMASVKTLKKDLIALHTTLKQAVKQMKVVARQNKPKDTTESTDAKSTDTNTTETNSTTNTGGNQ